MSKERRHVRFVEDQKGLHTSQGYGFGAEESAQMLAAS
jgi:hypothetical protein